MRAHPNRVNAINVLNQAIVNVAHHLSLTQKDLHDIIGTSKPQLSRLFTSGTPCVQLDTKEWECALLFLRMIRSLEAIVGEDPVQSNEWLKNYNHHLDGVPLTLIKNIQGLTEVVSYLDAMRGQG